MTDAEKLATVKVTLGELLTMLNAADPPPPPPPPPPSTGTQDHLPFDAIAPEVMAAKKRVVIAHWHYFQTEMNSDNGVWAPQDARPPGDYWNKFYLSTNGDGSSSSGPYLRDRPLHRAPRPGTIDVWRIEDNKEEIRKAQAMSIDAFQFNIQSTALGPTSDVMRMLEAAKQLNTGFKVMASFDCDILKAATPEHVAAVISQIRTHPNILRRDGKLVLGCFRIESWPVDKIKQMLALIGEPVFYVPHFLDWSFYPAYKDVIQGVAVWRGNNYNEYPAIGALAKQVKADGKAWAAPIWAQDVRHHVQGGRRFWESRGSYLWRTSWQQAIDLGADFAFITTWNDYAEGHHVQPSLNIQYLWADLCSYYAAWFKTGEAPKIVRDVLYYVHRIERTDAPTQGSPRMTNQCQPDYNDIELLGFLTAPGTLQINGVPLNVPEGIQSYRVPFAVGKSAFKLIRDGKEVISFASNFTTRATSPFQDLLYRGGSNTRPSVLVP